MCAKSFDLGVQSFQSDVKMASVQVDQTFFVLYTDEEKFVCRKEMKMTAYLCAIADTQYNCTGVGETPAICLGVVEMPSDLHVRKQDPCGRRFYSGVTFSIPCRKKRPLMF